MRSTKRRRRLLKVMKYMSETVDKRRIPRKTYLQDCNARIYIIICVCCSKLSQTGKLPNRLSQIRHRK